ncbi:MAG: GLPGLI family protein [Pedobacter sp.]|nr:MAG: GLPGLI family protein [Pedobacter sp.]
MKKILSICTGLLIIATNGFAQVKQGKVVYIADFTGVYNKSMKNGNYDLANMMKGIAKVSKEIKLQLVFDETQSSFTRSKAMANDFDAETYNTAAELSLDGDYYNNIKTKQLLKTVKDDKTYLISMRPLRPEDWKLTKESKKIGNYTCYKATSTKQVEGPKGMVNVGLTAWYAPEIPVRFGPKQYSNLPGLILEVQEGEVIYRCIGIALNQASKVAVSIPVKGTRITEAGYDKIIHKRLQQFKQGNSAR